MSSEPAGNSAQTPYANLPANAFWRSAVADCGAAQIGGLWQPKFNIAPGDPVATFGSCFAQHIGRALRRHGLNWLITESPPRRVSSELARAYGYGLFSARTGNIYTPTMLLQWLQWALTQTPVPTEIWHDGDRLRDPFRPRLEPEGFENRRELNKLRDTTLRALRHSVKKARVMVFTLGLTERWIHAQEGYEYPLCPGTAAGQFDERLHRFAPLDYPAALQAMSDALDLMRTANPELRFLLTVSPVPLTATATGAHVLSATIGAKSVLRAVAGHLAQTRADTDYFPSYELITSPVFGGQFFAANQRSVTDEGVQFVMGHFFRDLAARFGPLPEAPPPPAPRISDHSTARKEAADDLVCEEELLRAFGPKP